MYFVYVFLSADSVCDSSFFLFFYLYVIFLDQYQLLHCTYMLVLCKSIRLPCMQKTLYTSH